MKSSRLRRGPVPLDLFGESLVAWRAADRRAIVASRFCPHQGASLALGSVSDGMLRCPFHGWCFDGDGRCVSIPGVDQIPPTARTRTYPVVERYGYIWVWYGSDEPAHGFPDFPPLGARQSEYIGFRYRDVTTGTVRHLLENAVDYYHFLTLHGLPLRDIDFSVLDDQSAATANGLAITPREAWFGARVHGSLPRPDPARRPYEWLVSVLSTFGAGEQFELLVDGWPGGQRFTFSVNGQEIYKVLMGTTPVSDRVTAQIGWAGVRRTGTWWRTAWHLLLFYVQNRAGTAQDVPIYDTTVTDNNALYVRYDSGVVRFRRWYQSWVARAAADGAGR
ncbi:Rieske 2Fe-2S domain-containing protein [Austwickia chelonae]|uniref:Rieske 2Fe-2S domain-containing protein n=1 Tax=Austwickia chelonae TaxID=100225 RepID=UPI001F07293F